MTSSSTRKEKTLFKILLFNLRSPLGDLSLMGPVRKLYRTERNFSNGAGFTLIELLLVVAIMAVITGMSLPAFKKTYNRLKVENTALNLLNITRYARERAIVESAIYRINFETDKKTYSLTVVDLDSSPEPRPPSGRYAKAFEIPADIAFESSVGSINFYPNGDCDSARIILTNSDNLRYELEKSEAFSDFEIKKQE